MTTVQFAIGKNSLYGKYDIICQLYVPIWSSYYLLNIAHISRHIAKT